MTKTPFIKVALLAVFICTVSLIQSQSYLTATINTPGNAGLLSENCEGPYELVLRRGVDNDSATTIFISATGTATIGTDYSFGSLFPIVLLPGDFEAVVPINVFNDGLNEGVETVILEIAFLSGTFSDFITLETSITDAYSVEIETPNDTIQWCRDVPYVLIASSDADEIFWSPSLVFDDSLGTAATVRPFESRWYYASVGSEECGAKDSVYFDLAIVEINNPDTVFICLGGIGAVLQGNIEGLAEDFTWSPLDGTLSNPLLLTPVANPTITTTYLLQSDIGVCTATDRVVVRVDSIPDNLQIAIAPAKPYYCAGEIVALFSPTFDSLSYPDLTFQWGPDDGTIITDSTLLNIAVMLQDTTLYFRDNTNNACTSRDSILINVVPPSVPLSVTDTMLCPGEMFMVEVLSDQVTNPEWSPEQGLSCTKCLNPTVTVIGAPGQTLFYAFSGMILDCPVGASLVVRIPEVQPINIAGDAVVCEGETVPLTITNPNGLTNIDWNIVSGDATLSCDDCLNPIVTINSINESIQITVNAETTQPGFCGAQGSITLTKGLTNQFNGPSVMACIGDMVTVSTGDPSVVNLMWSVLSGSVLLSCTDCENPVVTILSPPSAQLRFIGETTDPAFCNVSGTVTVSTFVEDVSNIVILPLPPIAQGSDVSAILDANPPTTTVMWTVNGTMISSTAPSIEFNASEETNFVVATFTNSKGCEQTDTISFVTVPPSFNIPNAFTPNNDDVNDRFRVLVNGNIVVEEFLIFNRWGQLVYEAPTDDLSGWDGRFKDVPAASDTYVYSAKIRFPDGKIDIAKGDLMLIR